MRKLRLGMAQINPTVGDFSGNVKKILEHVAAARELGVDLIAFPELAVCGYPPEDLLLKPQFVDKNIESLQKIATGCTGLTAVIGFVDKNEDLYNAAAIIHNGKIIGVYHKIYLPNYGVFDENRYFRAGKECPVYVICGVGVGINVCEDIWYEAGPATVQSFHGAEVIVNISSSPYYYGKRDFRERMLSTRAADNTAIIAYINAVGGQDELVFDGDSVIMDEKGRLIARGKQFAEDLIVADLDVDAIFRTRLHDPRWRKEAILEKEYGWLSTKVYVSAKPLSEEKPTLPPRNVQTREEVGEVYEALVMGTRDYVRKNGFKQVHIGISGGVDSSMVATIAVDALEASNVNGISMPTRFSSAASVSDAELLAKNLGINFLLIPIEQVFKKYLSMLEEAFKGKKPDITEENIQARIRGNILMALSNKFGSLVLTTGNKSEMATGYTTLYGDLAGGFAVLKDVPKTMVYQLARYRNSIAKKVLIPETILSKPASAELRPGQETQKSLAPFEILDPILSAYVEEDKSIEQIINMGFNEATVKRIARLVDISEYKRRQAPPGIKITPRAFGRDRRLPITNRFKG